MRRLVRDLNLPVRIVVCPTVREPDGLALSSRNARLAPDERERALSLSRGLHAAERCHADGERDATRLRATAAAAVAPPASCPSTSPPSTRDPLPVRRVDRPVLLAVAARIGGTRLIDNVLLGPSSDDRDDALVDGPGDRWPTTAPPRPSRRSPRT